MEVKYYLKSANLSDLSTINPSCEFIGLVKEFYDLYKQGEGHITFRTPFSLTTIAFLCCEYRNMFQGKRPGHCGVHCFERRSGSIEKMATLDPAY